MQLTKIPVEQRFPLTLRQSISSIRELYEVGKEQRWVPHQDIDWGSLDFSGLDEATRRAASLTWSRRAWVEYASLTETPALLVRLCLEAGRESDPKYFLTVRNTEEAWHIECCHRYAKALGGYIDRPSDKSMESVFNQNRYRKVLDAKCHTDAFLMVHAAFEDNLELALYRSYLLNATEPVARRILDQFVQAKERHVEFGWLYAHERSTLWTDADRQTIAEALRDYLLQVELKGYHCPWLADPDGAEARALDMTAKAGLGAISAAEEQQVFEASLQDAHARLAELGVSLDLSEIMPLTRD